jgi:hypothetical protein
VGVSDDERKKFLVGMVMDCNKLTGCWASKSCISGKREPSRFHKRHTSSPYWRDSSFLTPNPIACPWSRPHLTQRMIHQYQQMMPCTCEGSLIVRP